MNKMPEFTEDGKLTVVQGKTAYFIPMDEIFSDPIFNTRGGVVPVDVIELSKDIDKHGLLMPILVRDLKRTEDMGSKYKYKIVSGHRRHMAFRVLKKESIPAFVEYDMSEERALLINIGENIHRKDLNILQEAKALRRLKMAGFSTTEVGRELGKSATWVGARYDLLDLPEEIQQAAAAGIIKQTQIKELHALPDMQSQMEAAKKIKSARASGEKVPQIMKPKRKMLSKKVRDKYDIFHMMQHIQESIGNNFGTRCLAWAAGEITTLEIYNDIYRAAEAAGKSYIIPLDSPAEPAILPVK
jgi:ParB family chromosome partitioning protein